jgi:hypothetical protein
MAKKTRNPRSSTVKPMPKTKTIIEVSITQTRCWSCKHLEKVVGEDPSSGSLVEKFKCSRNAALPERLPPHFAEKCELYTPINSHEVQPP